MEERLSKEKSSKNYWKRKRRIREMREDLT
jgi:hypothetical protein